MKIFLIVVSILLVLALGAVGYVWFLIQELETAPTPTAEQTVDDTQPASSPSSTETLNEPIVIQRSDIPESQQQVLDSFGLDGESYTITPAMVSCAEDAVGKVRFNEIVGGAAPTTLESLKLLPCLKN